MLQSDQWNYGQCIMNISLHQRGVKKCQKSSAANRLRQTDGNMGEFNSTPSRGGVKM